MIQSLWTVVEGLRLESTANSVATPYTPEQEKEPAG
jgi:hypothetical protein